MLLALIAKPFHAYKNGTDSMTAPLIADLILTLKRNLQDFTAVHCGCVELAICIVLRRRP